MSVSPLLQAASGESAEAAREDSLKANRGQLLLVVDGSVPTALEGACSTIAGEHNLSLLKRCLSAADAGQASVERGARVYDSQCVHCHDADPAALAIPPEDVPDLLRSGVSAPTASPWRRPTSRL